MRKKGNQHARDGFMGFMRIYRWRILWLSFLMMLQSLLQVMMAVLSRYVIDAALGTGENLLFWGIVLVADILALVGVHGLLSWCAGKTADTMSAKLRRDMLLTAAFSRDERLLDHHSGELLSRGIEDVYSVCDGAVNVLPNLLGQLTRLVAAFVAIILISPSVAGVLLIVAAVVGGGSAALRPVIRRQQRRVRETDEKVMATMQEDLQQLELIQSLDAQEQIVRRFGEKLEDSLRMRFKRRVWTVGSNTAINAASLIGSGVLLLWGASQVADHMLSYGALTAMIQLFSVFRTPVLGLSGILTRFATVEVAAERLWELLKPVSPVNKLEKEPNIKAIVFEDVSFAYPGEEIPVLQDFNFCFPLDGWTCLTGVSGRGKTTIFKLILGLYKPQQGRIYLKTEDEDIPCTEAVRHLFAYVPQDYALFSGTILENLRLVAPDADEDELRRALSIAQADFVWELADKMQTQVRENNVGLSKGQLQRLAIARAVLMERPIFLLDECTSALDAQTEDDVLRGLHALGKRAMLVTHRPDALHDLNGITLTSMGK
jgi:ATP-binding cassette subfamily B protein